MVSAVAAAIRMAARMAIRRTARGSQKLRPTPNIISIADLGKLMRQLGVPTEPGLPDRAIPAIR
jgi:hypothetical protein